MNNQQKKDFTFFPIFLLSLNLLAFVSVENNGGREKGGKKLKLREGKLFLSLV